MKYKLLLLLSFFVISVVPLVDLTFPGLPLTHDGQDHVARIANFYRNLQEGNIIPRWAQNLNWGYGHPILMFLYPLPSYMASLFHFMGFSFIESVKLVFGVSFVLSGLAMYLWTKEFLGWEGGFASGLLYMYAPYRFVDLYVRGAIGEHVAFIFPPLVLLFLLKLSKQNEKKYLIAASVSLSFLILAHNAISLMFLPIIILYSIFLYFQIKKKAFLFSAFVIFIFAFGLSAFFWIPAFFEGKYTLRDKVSSAGYLLSFVNFKNFVYGPWNYGGTGQFSVQVGIVHWLVTICAFVCSLFIKESKKISKIVIASVFFMFFVMLFLMSSVSIPVWKLITVLQKFQFPWRFLSVVVFLTSLMGGIFLMYIPKKAKKLFLFLIIFFTLVLNKDYWHAKGYLKKEESFYSGVHFGTTDTGESAPIWSIRFMEETPKDTVEIIEGKGDVKKIYRTTTRHEYRLIAENKVRVRENTLYFPGWEVLVDSMKVPIEFQDPNNRGLMTFFVNKGSHTIQIIFKETKLRVLSDAISGVNIGLMVLYIILPRTLWKKYL